MLFTASTGCATDREAWAAGFSAAHKELLVDRLAMYGMLHRVRHQSFLPRVLATWQTVHEAIG
jgi:hypothetical protein